MINPCNRVRDIIKFSLRFAFLTFLVSIKRKEIKRKRSYANLIVSDDITQGKV